jgi:magnesium-transporting ATPase (P-type)
LVYLCTFGLNDPLREDIQETVNFIRFGEKKESNDGKPVPSSTVNIKMVTGDHIETARFVAVESGIITKAESEDTDVIMSGQDFMEKIGPYERSWNPENEDYDVVFDDVD